MTAIAERLRVLRGGLSQQKFAASFGLMQSTYGYYERGIRPPDTEVAATICRTLGVNPRWLILGEGPIYDVDIDVKDKEQQMKRFEPDNATAEFFNKTLDALAYAENKHKSFPTDRIHASAILNEEAGKLTQACIDYEYGNITREEAQARMEKYVARVGAMSLRFFQSLPA